MKSSGIWICVTGIDGVGKTTLSKYIIKLLGKKSKFMKIPYFDWVREMIRISGNNKPLKDRYTDMLIFSASNRLEMYVIRGFLRKHKYLVSQRSWLDNFPYRRVEGYSYEESAKMLKPDKFLKPDIIFFLSCDHKTAYNRIKNDNGDKYEEPGFMKKLEAEFEKMFSQIKRNNFIIKLPKTRIITLDATINLKELKKEITDNLIRLRLL